jgi:hypothetical protein
VDRPGKVGMNPAICEFADSRIVADMGVGEAVLK